MVACWWQPIDILLHSNTRRLQPKPMYLIMFLLQPVVRSVSVPYSLHSLFTVAERLLVVSWTCCWSDLVMLGVPQWFECKLSLPWITVCFRNLAPSPAGPASGSFWEIQLRQSFWRDFWIWPDLSKKSWSQSWLVIVSVIWRFTTHSQWTELIPGFHHSVAILPLPFRRSAVVIFRCCGKIT